MIQSAKQQKVKGKIWLSSKRFGAVSWLAGMRQYAAPPPPFYCSKNIPLLCTLHTLHFTLHDAILSAFSYPQNNQCIAWLVHNSATKCKGIDQGTTVHLIDISARVVCFTGAAVKSELLVKPPYFLGSKILLNKHLGKYTGVYCISLRKLGVWFKRLITEHMWY